MATTSVWRTSNFAHLITSPRLKEAGVVRDAAIYFLLKGNTIVYIGKTKNVSSVIGRHVNDGRGFDRVLFRPIADDENVDIDTIEQATIVYFRPRGNREVFNRKFPVEKAEPIVCDFLGIAPTLDSPALTVSTDIVMFGYHPGSASLRVVLIHRLFPPFKGGLALPGGRVEPDESAEEAALRELQEETDIKPSYLEQLYTFTDPHRDSRGRVVSVAYFGLVSVDRFEPQAGSDAADAQWCEVTDALNQELAFDHHDILQAALERLKGKVRYTPIGFDLLPSKFTTTDLRRLYETILGHSLDASNFRKKILALGLLTETGDSQTGRHRPAPLYRFNKTRYEALSKKGFNFEV